MLSSHNVADVERVCDHLVIISAGRVVAAGDLDAFRDGHRLLVGPRAGDAELAALAAAGEGVRATHTDRQTTVLLRAAGPDASPPGARWEAAPIGFEDVVIEYLSRTDADADAAARREVA